MAEKRVVELEVKTSGLGGAKKSMEDLTATINEQKKIAIDLERELQKVEQQLKNTPKNAFTEQKKLTDQMNHLKDSIKDQSLSLKELAIEKNNTIKPTVALRTQLKNLKDQMGLLDQNSPEWKKLALEAGQLKDKMDDMNRSVKNLASDTQKLDVAMEGIGAAVGVFGAGTGVMALMGNESEELQKTMMKLQAVMTVLNSLKAIENALNKDSALSTMLKTRATQQAVVTETTQVGVTKSYTIAETAKMVATKASTVATKALNAVMNANPVMLLISGITALVGAIMYFTRNTYDAEAAQEKLNKSIERGRKLADEFSDRIVTKSKRRLEMMQAEGASEEALHKQRLELIKAEEKARQGKLLTEENVLKNQRRLYQEFIDKGELDKAREIKTEIEATKEKFKTLLNLEAEHRHKTEVENASFKKKQSDDELKNNEESIRKAKARQDRIAQEKEKERQIEEQAQKRREAQMRMIEDIEDSMIEDATERQFQQTVRKYTRLMKEAEDNAELHKLLQTQLEADLEKIRVEADEKERELKKQEEAKDLENLKTLQDLQVQNIKDENERKLAELKLYYERQRELHKGNADILAELKIQEAAKEDEIEEERIKKEEERAKKVREMRYNSVIKTANGIAELMTFFGKGDEKRQRNAFELQKKVSIASALVDTYKSAVSAYKSLSGVPIVGPALGGAAAATAVGLGLKNISNIRKQQFNGGSSGGGGSDTSSAPSLGSSISESPTPQFSTIGSAEQQSSTQQPLQAFVVSGEVSTAQELDRRRVKFATF